MGLETCIDQQDLKAFALGHLDEDRSEGGPPVMPPQPDGMWRSTYNGQKWVNAEGEDRFRRAIYTYLKRTTPYPSMITFDGGSGEVCQIRTSYSTNSQGALALIKLTHTTTPDGITDAEFASWIVVANTILNLDEFLTRN